LVSIEFLAFGLAMILAVALRLGPDLASIQTDLGPLWTRALVFALAGAVSFLALGLYSIRARIGALGVALRVVIACVATMGAAATIFYLVPSIQIGRGVL